MNKESAHDDGLDLGVYLGLLVLTGATLAAGTAGHQGRIVAVAVALIIASLKASLIGFYYMGLRRERGLVLSALAIGALAVLALLVGILPDLTFRRF